MTAAHQLSSLRSALTDLRALFQHQARASQEALAEVMRHWTGPHGRHFVDTHLTPQTRLHGPTSDALQALSYALAAAARHGERAEAHLAQARLATDDVQQEDAEAARLALRAQQLAALARGRTHNAEAHARGIGCDLNSLGTPPM